MKRIAGVAALIAACNLHETREPYVAPPALPRTTWVVIAPHPDDETLIGAATLAGAVENGKSVAVIVMTNGDFDCVHDGLLRETESVKGMDAVGVPESRIFFLGYPDGGLPKLGRAPLPQKRLIQGNCQEGSTTYGAHGANKADFHTARFKSPASYTRAAAVADLTLVLRELRPENVILTHPEDTHPDHATTYMLFRAAMDALDEPPRVHRAIVHNGDCWPIGTEPREPCPVPVIDPAQHTPPLIGQLAGYEPRERLPVPDSCRIPDPAQNKKLRAIAAHASQTRGTLASYLFGFARSDEIFFPETFVRDGRHYRREDGGELARVSPASFVLVSGQTTTLRTGAGMSLHARVPHPVAAAGIVTFRVMEDASGAYFLELDRGRVEARLSRQSDAGKVLLQEWPLAHDLWSEGDEDIELAVEPRPRDGDVAEISLSVRGELVGLAVDVHPRRAGDTIAIDGLPQQSVTVRALPR